MNFKKIFELQTKLDQEIEKKHQIDHKKVVKDRILALIVEVSELANEISSFKYWKKNKVYDRNKILEEFVDGIHFYVSLSLSSKIKNYQIKPKLVTKIDINRQLLNVYDSLVNLNKKINKKKILNSFSLYLGLAKLLNIDYQEIEKHYINKNTINHQRLLNNY